MQLNRFALMMILVIAPLSSWATEQAPPLTATLHAMGGIPINISAWDLDEETFEAATEKITSRLEFLEAMMSTYRPESEISQINNGEKLESYPEELLDVLRRALDVSTRTDGAFDITVKPLVKLWKSSTKAGHLPTETEITDAMESVGYGKVNVTDEGVLELSQPGVMLDLGGIAKGYFADEAVLILRKAGATKCLVDCGGDISAYNDLDGEHGAIPFRVGVKNPLDKESILAVLELGYGAVVTSGNYERYYEIGGTRYCHIFDPRTGQPVENMLSVTLVASNGLYADAFATAVFVMGPEAAREFVEERSWLEAVIISGDGQGDPEVFVSSGLADKIEFVGK